MGNWNMLSNRIDQTLFLVLDKLVDYLYNLVDYVSLIRCVFFKKLQYKKQKYSSSWQEAPEDVIEMILKHTNLSGRVRFSSLCKFWRCVSMRRDIHAPPQLPWLVHPQVPAFPSYLSFSSLSEGKIFKFRFPRTNYGTLFCGSSKGWLFMSKMYGWLSSEQLFLLNPISGARHQLPYLVNCSTVEVLALSSNDISECIVAIVLNDDKELGLCRPGDKSWSVFQVLDETNYVGDITRLLFSSSGTLFALVEYCSGANGVGAVQTLKLGGDIEVKLQLVYFEQNWWINNGLIDVFPGVACHAYLLESTNNEVLLIHHFYEDMGGEGNNEENEDNKPDGFVYFRTKCFGIYKIDADNCNFLKVQTLGDQILFVANYGSSLALPASDFKELQGNCIYFATIGGFSPHLESCISREIGIFYLDSGRVERPFPSMMIPRDGCGPSWFTPSLLDR
ncbi:probable F-box protein At1g65740 [Rosa rugosa]|uniref:probable F-box protein At1g65740 n=1 Tax=Rosa rugosa TaxID=74645 RepID=UPI002B41766F|nr:probable F-box protein At1g65740 [Rosa rugosa]